MLVLRASGTVAGDGGPAVWPRDIAPVAEVDHGLDRERVTFFHRAHGFVVGVMRNVWGAVEESVDAVAAVRLHDGTVVSSGVSGDDVTDISIARAGFDGVDPSPQALQGDFEQVL